VTASDAQVVLGATEALNEAAETGELRSMIETWLDPEFEYFPPLESPSQAPTAGTTRWKPSTGTSETNSTGSGSAARTCPETSGRVTYWQSVEVQGKGSGAVVADNSYCVVTVRDGRLLRIVEDYDRTKALRRVGLEREVG
jgi:hypothetical protein